MIHKHIFVHAKPSMSEQDFFKYWKEVHAERYGRKIKQAKGYLINTRVPYGPQESEPPFQGVAEVWIENAEDALAFAQSKEYLEGSRLDEPNFLLWYGMFALDTTDHVVVEPPAGDWPGIKVFVVTKRKPGMSLDKYRTYGREVHAPKVAKLPGLRGYVICRVDDGHYAVGESLLDTVSLLWFDSTDALAKAQQSETFQQDVAPDLANFVDQRYVHVLVTEGHWVTRLGGRIVIHQFIFAAPKPGMTEQEFQDYWVNVHGVKYASKIPQIKQYSVSTRLPFGDESQEPLWSGLADIWIENEEDQVASLWSEELLEGARIDEPRWAAYWRTVVLDTDTHVLKDGGGLEGVKDAVKLVALVKRKWGMPLEDFRRHSLETHAALDLKLPGLRRYVQCHARDGMYGIGETPFDAVSCLWFDSPEALQQALATPENEASAADLPAFLEMKYAHVLLMKEHWVIGPIGAD